MEKMGKSGEERKEHASRLPKRKHGYFRDDQIVLLATQIMDLSSEEPEISEEQLKSISDEIMPDLKKIKEDAMLSSKPPVDTLRYDTNESNKQSLLHMIPYHVEKAPENPLYLTEVISQFNKKSINKSINGLTIVGASPNWLTSVASQGGGTGGPGGRPSPFNGSRTGAPAGFVDLITSLKDKNLYSHGTGVDVAILDTAPCAHDLVAAPKEWPDHPLISKLLGPDGKLSLYPANYDQVVRLGNTSLNDHDYNMTDHGLFVAGIIHSIVPEANIHLVEVLNQYGVGDFTSFVRGLRTVLNEIYNPKRKLVINCSWMLEFPRDPLHCRHTHQTDPDAEFEREVLQFSMYDQATLLMLESLFNQFFFLGRQAIAAAGNDGREEDTSRIPSRYPAALEKVTGVGALPKMLRRTSNGEFQSAIYSNLADEPKIKGIMTLGGEEGEGNGVLGVYVGEFPVEPNPSIWRSFLNWLIVLLGGRVAGPRNLTKWAWWAGTSFATPILTGAVAAVLSSSDQIATTQDAIEKLYSSGIIGDSKMGVVMATTDVGEDVMAITQSRYTL